MNLNDFNDVRHEALAGKLSNHNKETLEVMHITCVRHFSVHGDFARDPASLIEKEMARQDELKKEQREAARHKEQADMMQEREAEHTLWAYWRLADWSERLGMIGALIGVFFVGYLCAKTDFVSRLIDLIRSIKP